MFQATINVKTHDAKGSSLTKVDKLVGRGTKKHLVVVTPMGTKPRITMSKDYLMGRLPKHSNFNKVFLVFHCQISENILFGPLSSNSS